MLTVIQNGKFTGTRYSESKLEYINFHESQGEICIWYEDEIIESQGETEPVYKDISSEDLLTYYKEHKKKLIHEEKKSKINEGVVVDGILFDSDPNARVAYQEFFIKASNDNTFESTWKASGETFVTMTWTLINQVLSAGETHLTTMFNWQKQQNDLVDDATTTEEVSNISHTYTE